MNYFCFLQWWLQVRHFLKQNKKVKHKDKDKSGCERKKTKKYFCLFQRLFQVPHFLNDCSSLCSTTGPWSRCTVKLKLIHYTALYSFSTVPYFIIFLNYIFYIAPPLFLHFHAFLLCTLLFLMCALLFYIFALRPTLFTLPITSCTFYHAFMCVCFFTLCPVFINRITNHRLQILWIIKKQKCRSWKHRELIKYQQPL